MILKSAKLAGARFTIIEADPNDIREGNWISKAGYADLGPAISHFDDLVARRLHDSARGRPGTWVISLHDNLETFESSALPSRP